jgi:hypothetical protein
MAPDKVAGNGPYGNLQNLGIINWIVRRSEEFYEKVLVSFMEKVEHVGI